MQRLKTREVRVGSIKIGGSNPIRIQSMTNTDTLDVEKTAEQIMLLRDNGCDIVRVAVLGRAHALACGDIKNFLLKHGYDVPLVADIHFFPQSALDVCDFVEKIRINPGNYIVGDKPSEVIESELAPLIEKCKKQKKVLRIGVNHGSLSDRILYYYGNTPQGMVVSALEYGAICEKYGFYDIVYSMKASDPVVMLEAYRYLVDQMVKKGNIYPLHLGVTEAGMGDDARVKSAAGIGALLLNGIGDTIRISLTENPENEIPPAKNLVALSEKYNSFSEEFTLWNKTEQKSFFYSNEESKINNKCILTDIDEKNLKKIKSTPADFIFFSPTDNRIIKTRILHAHLLKQDKKKSLIACFSYEGDYEKIIIEASAELGILLLDNIIDGIHFNIPLTAAKEKFLSQAILQATKKKLTRAEFISCPGCGRTLFDIQKLAQIIKERTSHLVGVKIAVMGCIVNGPGEMADADFGVVGSSKESVNLYYGKICVEKNVFLSVAADRLVELIKRKAKWVDQNF